MWVLKIRLEIELYCATGRSRDNDFPNSASCVDRKGAGYDFDI
jgi:hypothetical protein